MKYQWRSFTIPTNGPVVETVHARPPALAWLQSQVGGAIETVPYFTKFAGRRRGTAYANEDGIALNLPINHGATWEWRKQGEYTSTLVGPVVITFRENSDA